MKLTVISDLHCEFAPYIIPNDIDRDSILIIAGDVCTQKQNLLEQLTTMGALDFRKVLLVLGNHDYWYGNLDWVPEGLPNKVSVLQNSATIEGDIKFFGGTMWFPRDPMAHLATETNDFEHIRNFASEVYDHNRRFKESFEHIVDSGTIVVSHHLPLYQSVPVQHKRDRQSFYVSPMDMYVNHYQPRMWIHGHTHTATRYMAGDTEIVCNPRGYPGQNRNYNPLVIDI